MNIIVSGTSFKTAPIEIREKMSFNETNELKKVLIKLYHIPKVKECVLLSTCNRTEVYLCAEEGFDYSLIEKALCEAKGLDLYSMKRYFYAFTGQEAVKHIFKVAAALDSMVIGEDQILGQFKDALKISIEMHTSSAILNTLLRKAITASKKIKTCAEKMKDNASVASLTIRLIKEIFKEEVKEKNVMVIGSGKIGSLIINQLRDIGINRVFLACRKYKNIEVPEYVQPVDYEKRYLLINDCDIIVSSTRSPHYTITKEMLEKNMASETGDKLFVDLAVPRDIDSQIAEINNVKYYNIDHFKEIYNASLRGTLLDLTFTEDIINEGIDEFKKWYRLRNGLSLAKEIIRSEDKAALKKSLAGLLVKVKDMDSDEINILLKKLKQID